MIASRFNVQCIGQDILHKSLSGLKTIEFNKVEVGDNCESSLLKISPNLQAYFIIL